MPRYCNERATTAGRKRSPIPQCGDHALCPYPYFVREGRGCSTTIPSDCDRRFNWKIDWTAFALRSDSGRLPYGPSVKVNL